MATETLYGTYANDAFVDVPVTNVAAANAYGRVRFIWDTVEALTGTAGSVYYMGGVEIPKGARILDAWMACDDLSSDGATLSLRVGTAVILAATDVASAATFTRLTTSDVPAVAGMVLTAAGKVNCLSAAGGTAGTITVMVMYAID